MTENFSYSHVQLFVGGNIFNSELEEINQVLQEISMQLPENTTYEQAYELWTSYSELLSEESFEVLQAIANKVANQAL